MLQGKIAHYEVLGELGAGGMGVVLRARDTRLHREVAIKSLPDGFAADPERMARFEREARTLASLSHPNVGAIYGLEKDDGRQYLILELVEGPTLAEVIAGGPRPLAEVLRVARQVAKALEAAHSAGIVHRDLKPANVKLTPDGRVKVLDFGLAKPATLGGDASSASVLERSPTLTQQLTEAGALLGTAAYMSPEQARGQDVDPRADIWAFGCLLYEMLTARRAFEGATVVDLLAAIVDKEPDWGALPAELPDRFIRLLRRCLRKDARQRLHHIADARIELEELASGEPDDWQEADPESEAQAPGWKRMPFLSWAVAGAMAVALTLALLQGPAPSPASRPRVRFSIPIPEGEHMGTGGAGVSISPDGQLVAFAANHIYLRHLDRLDVELLAGTEQGLVPFFSPDGGWLAFTQQGKLRKLPVSGGATQVICDANWGAGSWGADGTIVFTPDYLSGLWRVSADGGEPEMLTAADQDLGELGHFWPQHLPDGEHVIFTSFSSPRERTRIEALSLRTGERKVLVERATFGRYSPSGHLWFVRRKTMMAVAFDLSSLTVKGSPEPVLEGVTEDLAEGDSILALSRTGTLVYGPGAVLDPEEHLVWVDRKGREELVMGETGLFASPRLSPDGERLAVTVESEDLDVWILDLQRGVSSRLTLEPSNELFPTWSPDGQHIFYAAEQPTYTVHRVAANGSASPEQLVETGLDQIPQAVTPDGRRLIFVELTATTDRDLMSLDLEDGSPPRAWRRTRFRESHADVSRDGLWVAYVGTDSGSQEVYVQRLDGSSGRVRVSVDGGTEPRWSADGRELYYRQAAKMMSVGFDPARATPGRTEELFEGPYTHGPLYSDFDVGADGRFVMIRPANPEIRQHLVVALDWQAELERLVPGLAQKD